MASSDGTPAMTNEEKMEIIRGLTGFLEGKHGLYSFRPNHTQLRVVAGPLLNNPENVKVVISALKAQGIAHPVEADRFFYAKNPNIIAPVIKCSYLPKLGDMIRNVLERGEGLENLVLETPVAKQSNVVVEDVEESEDAEDTDAGEAIEASETEEEQEPEASENDDVSEQEEEKEPEPVRQPTPPPARKPAAKTKPQPVPVPTLVVSAVSDRKSSSARSAKKPAAAPAPVVPSRKPVRNLVPEEDPYLAEDKSYLSKHRGEEVKEQPFRGGARRNGPKKKPRAPVSESSESESDNDSELSNEDTESDSGSDSGSDSQNEETIETIREAIKSRKQSRSERRRKSTPIEIDDEIYSDQEDLTSISRRLRYQRGLMKELVDIVRNMGENLSQVLEAGESHSKMFARLSKDVKRLSEAVLDQEPVPRPSTGKKSNRSRRY